MQLIVQMQSHLMESDSSSSILKNPGQVVSFIQHALEEAVQASTSSVPSTSTKLRTAHGERTTSSIRVVPEVIPDEIDSDDEAPQSGGTVEDEDMTEEEAEMIVQQGLPKEDEERASIDEKEPQQEAQKAPSPKRKPPPRYED